MSREERQIHENISEHKKTLTGDLDDDDEADQRHGEGVDEHHDLRGVVAAEEEDGVEELDPGQDPHEDQEGDHGLGAAHAGVEVLLEDVRPVDEDEDEDAEEAERADAHEHDLDELARPEGVGGVEGHDGVRRVVRRPGGPGHGEPRRPEGGRCEDEAVEGRDHGRL